MVPLGLDALISGEPAPTLDRCRVPEHVSVRVWALRYYEGLASLAGFSQAPVPIRTWTAFWSSSTTPLLEDLGRAGC